MFKRARTTVSTVNLERLGATKLADLLVEQARHDRSLRETLARVLAETAGEAELYDYLERRLAALAKGREVDVAGARTLGRELQALRGSTVDVVARRNVEGALGLLRRMIELGPALNRRMSRSHDAVAEWQEAVLRDLARLWNDVTHADTQDLAAFVAATCLEQDDAGRKAIAILAPLLGTTGLQRLRTLLQAELDKLPAESAGRRWQVPVMGGDGSMARAWRLRWRLGDIADQLGDVDGFIALECAQPRAQVNVRAIVGRLLKAGRGAEALAWLDDARYHNRLIATLDLRLAALESIGRHDEAQTLRWQTFERKLDAGMLRDYLKRLPDFEDFEAERRAMEHAHTHKSAAEALAFMVTWPDPDNAASLVRERWREFGATPPETLLDVADALRGHHPAESVGLVRIAVRAVLDRGLARLFERAARALAACAALEPPSWPDPEPEPHDVFVDRLRAQHQRHWAFWRAHDPAEH